MPEKNTGLVSNIASAKRPGQLDGNPPLRATAHPIARVNSKRT